jgi:8-oxo-dGTP diphosphatase
MGNLSDRISVAVALIVIDDEVLIAKRNKNVHQGDQWEFPGGKIEEGETPFHALQRECLEELDIKILSAHPWMTQSFNYPDKLVLLDIWWVEKFQGNPCALASQELCWAKIQTLKRFNFLAANKMIIDRLEMSQTDL